jgi:hypothetical protein
MYNHRQKIQDILNDDYNTKEKIRIKGEVFTPFDLIEEMLDKLPENIWYDPEKTWIDPAAGLGNFFAVVVERLMKGLKKKIPNEKERFKNIIERQLYFVELNPESARLIKEIFDPFDEYKMNIANADFLDEDHPGWDEVGYKWDEDDKKRRQNKKRIEQIKTKFIK